MDPPNNRLSIILGRPIWHIFYPTVDVDPPRKKECCYVMDDETFREHVKDSTWYDRFATLSVYIQELFEALGQDVYALTSPLKPYHDTKTRKIYLPEKNRVEAWANSLDKYIILHTLELNPYLGSRHHEAYRVGKSPSDV